MQKILVVLGPTAVGKSDLAVELALRFNGEVISADSRQIYQGLDIGTGKITEEEARGVPHHLLNIALPNKTYSVSDWKRDAEEKIEEIIARNKLPIICGGTGQYIQAVVDNISFPEVSPNLELRDELENKSAEELFTILKCIDTRRAKTVDQKNPRRLIRAIEIAKELGSVPILEVKTPSKYNAFRIGLTLPREELKKRINFRLEKRLNSGMIEEVESLYKDGLPYERMEELGLEYRYLAKYLKEEITFDEMKEKLSTEISRYAKRQMTWFNRDEKIQWFLPTKTEAIAIEVKRFLDR